MQKKLSLIVPVVASLVIAPAFAATTYSTTQTYVPRTTSYSSGPVYTTQTMYSQPANRTTMYRQLEPVSTTTTVRGTTATNTQTTRRVTTRGELKRKYFLAHPFFQPIKGKFGSVTDLGWSSNSYKMSFTNRPDTILDLNGTPATYSFFIGDTGAKWNTDMFTVKEDFSYGITDKFALMGMLQYDSSKYKLKWDDPTNPEDKMDDSGINLYGLGGRFRFVDNTEWIATASAYFQHQKDIANTFILDVQAGYKVASTTIYGLARGWYVDFDGDVYGDSIEGHGLDAGDYGAVFFAYKTNTSDAFYVEGGLGVFSVLAEDWTLNLEAVLGNYDWHNQMSIKGAFGWQPNDWFALNLYAKASLFDSANDKTIDVYGYNYRVLETGTSNWTQIADWMNMGTAKVKDYKDYTVGLQAIFMF